MCDAINLLRLIASSLQFGVATIPAVTIRNLPDETHRARKSRAAQHGRSAEAEMRAILEAAVRPETRLRLDTTLFELGRKAGLTNADIDALNAAKEQAPAEPIALG